MSPFLVAAAVFALAALLCAVALASARRERFGRALLCVFLLGLLLRGYAAADHYVHEWDERYHLLVAKHLSVHPLRPTLYEDPVLPYDPHEWFGNHVWLHKPPLTLWLLALGVRLFGTCEPLLRMPSVVISSLAVLLTYAIGARLFARPAALLAASFHAINGFLIDLAAGRRPTDHVDSLFIALVEAGVFLAFLSAERGHPWGIVAGLGAVTGLALLTKSSPAVLVLAVWLVLLWRGEPGLPRKRRAAAFAIGAGVAVAVAAPWFLYARAAFPQEAAWESAYELRHLVEPLEGHTGTILSHLGWMPRFFGELVYLPLLWFVWQTSRGDRDTRRVALLAWLVLPYLVFSLVATKMPAYPMVAAPAVFLIEGAFAVWVVRTDASRGRRARLALFGLLLVLPVRNMLERFRRVVGEDRRRAWAEELRALEKQIGPEPCVIFATPHPIEAMFYTHCSAYPGLPPGPALVLRLEKAGYRVLVPPSS